MFPPFADPDDPAQDQAAREMGLRLVEHCAGRSMCTYCAYTGDMRSAGRRNQHPGQATSQGLKTKDRPRRGQTR